MHLGSEDGRPTLADAGNTGEGTPRAARSSGARYTTHDDARTALEHLRGLTGQRAHLERAITAAVIDARSAGASWNMVADAIGISRQGARQRWGLRPPAQERHDRP